MLTTREESVSRIQRNHAEQQPDAADEVGGIRDVGGRLLVDYRLRPVEPRLHLGQLPLGRPHRVEVGVQLLLIGRADPPAQRRGLRLQPVQNAAAVVEALRLALDLLRRALQEQPLEQVRRAGLGRHHRAARGEGLALRAQRAEHHRREAGHVAEVVRRHLVERHRVAEAVEAGTPRRGQPSDLGVVGLTAALLLVRETGEQRVPRAVRVDEAQVLCRLVVGAGGPREPRRRIEPERAADGHHSPRRLDGRGAGRRRRHRFEQRQAQRHAGGPQERTPIHRSRKSHGQRLLKRSLCTTS